MGISVADLVATLGIDDREFDRGLDGVGSKFNKIGPMAAAAGAAAGAALAAGVVKAMDVEAINDKLAAQLDLTAAESERIGGVAGHLYADAYGESMQDVSTAVAGVRSSIEGMTQATEKELEAASAKALDFAAIFEIDITRATSTAGILTKSGLAKDATEAFDLMTAASQRVPAQLREDVLDAADEYSQFFASLGMDGQQAFALLVANADKGMYGIDKVGDAVKEFSIRATDLSAASKGAYEAIGLGMEEMTNKLLAGGDSASEATQQIVDGLLSIEDPGRRAEASIALFGTPLEDLNVNEIPEFLRSLKLGEDAMEGFAGASERAGDTLNDNAKTKLTAFRRTLESGLVNFLGGTVIPAIEKVGDVLGPVLMPVLRTLGSVIKPIAPVLIGMAGAFGSLWAAAKGYQILKGAVGTIRDLTGLLRGGVSSLGNFAGGLSRAGSAGGEFAGGLGSARGGAGRLAGVLGKGGALAIALAFTTTMIFKAVDAWSQYNAAAEQAEQAYQDAMSNVDAAEQYIIEKYGKGSERHQKWLMENKGSKAAIEADRYQRPDWYNPFTWFGSGGDFIARSPQIIGVGDVAERVTITPLNKGGAQNGVVHHRPISITISGVPSRRQLEQLKRDLARVDIGSY